MVWHGSSKQEDSVSDFDLEELVRVASQVDHALQQRKSRLYMRQSIDQLQLLLQSQRGTEHVLARAIFVLKSYVIRKDTRSEMCQPDGKR